MTERHMRWCIEQKTEEALIYVYNRPIARLSSQVHVAVKRRLYTSKLRHPDHTAVIEIDESLFWLQTSVKAFWNNTTES